MNKKLLAIAVAALVAAPAIATAQTTLFGQVKYEVGYIEDAADDHNLTHSTRGTRLGVRGAEDLGGGLQGIYRLQGSFASVNTSFAAQNYSMDEEAWVGLQGGFGRLLLGRSDSAVKLASSPFRAFTDTLADGGVTRPLGWQRAEGIHYTTPNFGGATLGLTVEPNGNETDAYYALNVIYKAGPLFVSAAYESSPEDATTFDEDDNPLSSTYAVGEIGINDSNYQVGASYNFGAGDVGVLFQARNFERDGEVNVITVPVNYMVTPNVNLRAAVQYSDADNGDENTNFAIGAQYNFSKRTELYANVWATDFESDVGDGEASVSVDTTNFGLGLRHSF